MTDEKLIFTRYDEGIVVASFNRPAAMNALDLDTMRAFRDMVLRLYDDAFLRVLVLTGAGERAFCSGGDLNELRAYPLAEHAQTMIDIMGDALLALERLPVPVIAAINGYALGGGSEIALACDIRIVDEHVRMGFVQVGMALTPGWGAGQRLLRAVGYARAMEILLKGEPMHAPELHALGLANHIVGTGMALPEAYALAQRIAKRPPAVVRGIKALLQAGLNQPYERALQSERAIFPPLWAAQDHLDAVEAFFKKQSERR